MPTLLQINSFSNAGSTGRIAEDLGLTAEAHGWQSWVAYGRRSNPSRLRTIRIGDSHDVLFHGLMTRLFDRQGLESLHATRKLISRIREIGPDIIHLHNLHGYYINYPLLFHFLSVYDRPVIWTLHDCWSFTGHCPEFESIGCFRWRTQCHDCPNLHTYPASMLFDRSRHNQEDKRHSFTMVKDMTLVPVSDWLARYVGESFLNRYPIHRIHNGINTTMFCPGADRQSVISAFCPGCHHLAIGVAGVWPERKGLADFISLRRLLPHDCGILLVGLSSKQLQNLPEGVTGLLRTESMAQLRDIYAAADVLFNPTLADSLPTVNLEAQSCGTPVVSYDVGGCAETLADGQTGWLVARRDVASAAARIKDIIAAPDGMRRQACRDFIVRNYRKEDRYEEYMQLYEQRLMKRNAQTL